MDRSKYKHGYYSDKSDKRMFVPKKTPGMGYTLNMANPKTKIFLIITIVPIIVLIYFLIQMSTREIEVKLQADSFMIDVPLYAHEFNYADIDSVELTDQELSAFRSNGYGGVKKAYGNFRVEGYGPCYLYLYKNVAEKIILKLSNEKKDYVFLNLATEEETQKLFEQLSGKIK